MSYQPSYMQRRVISRLYRRNVQGWGRPRAYTLQRVRVGGLLLGTALVAFVIDILINGANNAVNWQGSSAVFLGFVTLLGAIFGISFLWNAVPNYLRAAQPPQTLTGTVEAAITDPAGAGPGIRNDYYFITLRLPDGKLKAFAIEAGKHDAVCEKGKQVRLIVQPGTDYVIQADAF